MRNKLQIHWDESMTLQTISSHINEQITTKSPIIVQDSIKIA